MLCVGVVVGVVGVVGVGGGVCCWCRRGDGGIVVVGVVVAIVGVAGVGDVDVDDVVGLL